MMKQALPQPSSHRQQSSNFLPSQQPWHNSNPFTPVRISNRVKKMCWAPLCSVGPLWTGIYWPWSSTKSGTHKIPMVCNVCHEADQEMWDNFLKENVTEDLDGTNFPGVVEVDTDNYNRLSLINWLLIFFALGGHTVILVPVELKSCFSSHMHSLLFCQSASHGGHYLWRHFRQVCVC